MKRIFQCNRMVVLLFGVLALAACSSDDPTEVAQTGTVSGTVNFSGTWPATGDVQVSIYANLAPPFIPMGNPDGVTEAIQGSPTTFNYSIPGLDKADYTAIFVGWRDPQNPQGARLIGIYWATSDSVGIAPTGVPTVTPIGVSIEDGNLVHTGLDMTADLDLIP